MPIVPSSRIRFPSLRCFALLPLLSLSGRQFADGDGVGHGRTLVRALPNHRPHPARTVVENRAVLSVRHRVSVDPDPETASGESRENGHGP